MESTALRLLVVSGGSGGHVVPAVAVLVALHNLALREGIGVELHYAGGEKDCALPVHDEHPGIYTKHVIRSGKVHRHATLGQVKEFVKMFQGVADARHLIADIEPHVVFTKGGAVSVAPALLASRLGIPVIAHETDVRSGLANRIVARVASTICTSWPAKYYTYKVPTVWTGQPVRPAFFDAPNPNPLEIDGVMLEDDLPWIVVTGGSLGARGINRLISPAYARYLEKARLIHICGHADYDELTFRAQSLPEAERERLLITPFVGSAMVELIKRATVVVTRSGGITAELAASAVPSVLIPLPTSAQDHQRANAAIFEQAGAALVCQQDKTTPDGLADVVLGLVENTEQQTALRTAIRNFAGPEAAQNSAKISFNGVDKHYGSETQTVEHPATDHDSGSPSADSGESPESAEPDVSVADQAGGDSSD